MQGSAWSRCRHEKTTWHEKQRVVEQCKARREEGTRGGNAYQQEILIEEYTQNIVTYHACERALAIRRRDVSLRG